MCALRQARILSSETDYTIKQEQQTQVNIKISKPQQHSQSAPLYPGSACPDISSRYSSEVPPMNNNINFIPANQPSQQVGQTSNIPMTNSQFQFQPQTSNLAQERGFERQNAVLPHGIAEDIGNELDTLETKNKFLEMVIQMYESNPLKVNSYVVCESKLLMDMIKLLTAGDKVELIVDDSEVGCGCTALGKFIKIAKILITKEGKTEDFKIVYNEMYTQFVKYGISLKIVI